MRDTWAERAVPTAVPAYLGWGNVERDTAGMRLYATDQDDGPRWAKASPGGRVVEYAVIEAIGQAEGDRFIVLRVGDRFMPDEVLSAIQEAVTAAAARVVDDAKAGTGG